MEQITQFLTIAVLCTTLVFTATPQGWKSLLGFIDWAKHRELTEEIKGLKGRVETIEKKLGLEVKD